jgi:hypothetical protein
MFKNATDEALVQQRITALRPKLENNSMFTSSFWNYYVESEQLLITLMTPPYTPPPYNANGSIEYGWVLYFLNEYMSWLPGLPASQITAADWTQWGTVWDGNGVCYGDGSLVNTQQYAVMDMQWAFALIGFLENYDNKHTPNPEYTTVPISTTAFPKQLNIGLFGDWGTSPTITPGNTPSPSSQVIAQLSKLNPDILIHLGDVYYSGTATEEQNNLLNQWIAAPTGNFALNSNHEMYDGANGLYNPTLINKIFTGQGQATYFIITYGDWIIAGLDSAYNATHMYMDGAITDSVQKGLLKTLSGYAAQGKKLLILTHHNPIIEPGGQINSLWTDVTGSDALNANPDYWYWGHIHNGVVYAVTPVTGTTACRCLGHAAIPYGNAPWFENNSNVDFFTNKTPNPSTGNPVQAMNGFAVLTLTPTGGITETWYYQDGSVAWTA